MVTVLIMPYLGPILADRLVTDPLQAQGTQRVPMILLAADGATHLADLELVTRAPPDAPATARPG